MVSISLQLPEGHASSQPGDARGESEIDWPFGSLPGNVSRLREGWRITARILKASGLALDPAALRTPLHASDAELDAHIARHHGAFYHGVGTGRLGSDDASVVDLQCAIRGVEGAHVVDASIVPRVPRTNTHLLAVAVAERASELLWPS